jgi:hypothetical protein
VVTCSPTSHHQCPAVPAYEFAQIRDWYADLYIDESKVYRVRRAIKVPYGWENRSQFNRIPLGR